MGRAKALPTFESCGAAPAPCSWCEVVPCVWSGLMAKVPEQLVGQSDGQGKLRLILR